MAMLSSKFKAQPCPVCEGKENVRGKVGEARDTDAHRDRACGGEQSLLVYELNRPKHNNNIFTTVNKNIYTTALAN